MDLPKLSLIQKSLRNYGSVRVKLEGKSMEPLIHHGTEVEIRATKFGEIKVSDIVAFKKMGEVVVHQCIYKGKTYLVTWGVNNDFTDGRVYPKNILGKVVLPVNTNLFNNWLAIEAESLNMGLRKIKVNPIWLKGPIYSRYLYGYFLNFKTPDLDILINRKKFNIVKRYLEKRGYTMEKKGASSVSGLPYAEIPFVKKFGKIKIDLDVHLIAVRCTFRKIYPQPMEPWRMMLISDELVKRPIKYMGFGILDDTSSLFHLCANLMFHHAGKGIIDLARIAKLIDKGSIDWKRFERLSYRYGLSGYVYYPLNWVRNIFGVNIPIVGRFKPSWFRHMLARLLLNRWTICRQNRLISWLDQRLNVAQIFYLRIVLSIFSKKPGCAYLHKPEVRVYSKI